MVPFPVSYSSPLAGVFHFCAQHSRGATFSKAMLETSDFLSAVLGAEV
jgi:hypothetical protein